MNVHIHQGALIDTPEQARSWARRNALGFAGGILAVIFLLTFVAPLTLVIGGVLATEVGFTAMWIFVGALLTLPVIAGIVAYRSEMRHFRGPCR